MRLVALLLVLALAGCTTPAAEEVDPAGTEATANETAAPTPTPTPVSPPPARQNTTAPTSAPAASPTPGQAAPPPPATVPWNLTGAARVGWLAAAGTGGAPAPTQGQTDADHCPDATFTVPPGAKAVRIVVTGEAVDPAGPGAGQLVLTLTGPDGTTVALDPGLPNPAEEAAAARELVAEAPVAGAWALHAEPFGPVVAQVWSLAIDVGGESEVAPAALVVAGACGG